MTGLISRGAPEEIREEHDRLGERLQRMAVVPK